MNGYLVDRVVQKGMIQEEDVRILNGYGASLKQPNLMHIKRLTDEPWPI